MAFLIPMVEKLLRLSDPIKKHHVGAIIISPTRYDANQTYVGVTANETPENCGNKSTLFFKDFCNFTHPLQQD